MQKPFKVEDFSDRANGICLECWDKTAIFDQFYKSVQAAHLLLLNSKYKPRETEIEIKSENTCSDDLLSVADQTADVPFCDYDVSDQSLHEDQNINEPNEDKGKLLNNKRLNKTKLIH